MPSPASAMAWHAYVPPYRLRQLVHGLAVPIARQHVRIPVVREADGSGTIGMRAHGDGAHAWRVERLHLLGGRCAACLVLDAQRGQVLALQLVHLSASGRHGDGMKPKNLAAIHVRCQALQLGTGGPDSAHVKGAQHGREHGGAGLGRGQPGGVFLGREFSDKPCPGRLDEAA